LLRNRFPDTGEDMPKPVNSDVLKGAQNGSQDDARLACTDCPVIPHGFMRGPLNGQSFPAACIFRRSHVLGSQLLYSETSAADQLFALRSGLVKIVKSLENGKERIIRVIRPGTIFGFEALGPAVHAASAVVLKESRICSVGREEFLTFLRANPESAIHVISILANDVTRFSSEITTMSFKDARTKVATLLCSLIGPEQTPTHNSVSLNLPFSFQEIGEILELSPETVSRSWSILQHEGIIKKRGRKVIVQDFEKLKDSARR
jgi:CRP-like cAMP-binding protein